MQLVVHGELGASAAHNIMEAERLARVTDSADAVACC